MRLLVAIVALPLALGLAAGCGEDGDKAAGAPSFEDVPWVLASARDIDALQASSLSATFSRGTVGGSTGCNRFTAPYTVDGDSLEIGQAASTQIACLPPAGETESTYLAALGKVASWRMDGAELVLPDGEGDELLRYRSASLVGDWQATATLSADAFSSPLPGTEITATFADDGSLAGSAGCNTYRTTYTTERGGIEIAPPAATRKACTTPAGVMEQEAAYLATLPTAARYRVDGGSLALLSADGTYVASFVPAKQP